MLIEKSEWIIISLVVFIILIGLISFSIYIKRRAKGKEIAKIFLEGLRDNIYNNMLKVIKKFKYNNYDNLVGIETAVIKEMISSSVEYVQNEIIESPTLTRFAINFLYTTDTIENFVKIVVNSIDVSKNIEKQLGDKYEEFVKNTIAEEEKYTEEFKNNNYYESDEDVKLEYTENRELTEEEKEEIKNLNPQTDEEESFNKDDDSMEVIDESKYYIDSRGRVHDKSTGKFVKL